MTLSQVKQLHNGDQVYWNDPDDGLCSRTLTIQSIEIQDEDDDEGLIVSIMEPDGSVVECFAKELS